MGFFDDMISIASDTARVGFSAAKAVGEVASVVTEPIAEFTSDVADEICDTLRDITR